MRTKLSFIATVSMLLLLGKVTAQNNVVYQLTQGTPAFNNTLIGVGTGLNCTNGLNTFVGNSAGFSNTSADFNTFIGASAGFSTTTGRLNTFLGARNVGAGNTTGLANVMIGSESGQFTTAGNFNVFVGPDSGRNNGIGSWNCYIGNATGGGSTTATVENNVAIGNGALQSSNGSRNISLGLNTATNMPATSSDNIIIGQASGNAMVGNPTNFTGSGNVFLGALITPTIATSGTMIFADGFGNQKMYIDPNGRVGIGLGQYVGAGNRLEINATGAGAAPGTAGLRFRNYTNAAAAITNPTTKVLSVDGNGDVILVNDVVGTGGGTSFTSTCGTNNFIPKSTSATSMVCSQIFDNGTSVGINTTGPFTYNNAVNPPFSGGTVPNSGTVRLDVNGIIRTVGIFATSDKKFKKDIKSIDGALETVMSLSGKTYFWNKDANKQMDFDSGLHSGVIAQEIEKVLPHLVVTSADGSKAVNYIELVPYLIEAIKTQQTQIAELQSQNAESFKNENTDLINLKNTKIISVSPNPSSNQIVVSLNIEKSVTNAKLQVHDLNGNVIGSFNITERDNNISKTLLKDNYGKGIYVVSLVVNGKSIDTKKIVFN